ncbi:MAG TPA: MazG family protein [Propionibacteriaceae bacterium]|nr:MazG family protein [Propionibacteriaceae bacterium]
MAILRLRCPWDAEQTHRSLVQYLIEEALETVEAIESGDDEHLREELGDLLLQVVFHAGIARERPNGFDLDDVARGVADKLVSRHPHVFTGEELPADLHGSWEQRKAVEKGRRSALEGIPQQMSAMARANKIIGRSRSHGVDVGLDDRAIDQTELRRQLLSLTARAQASGIDPEQALRDAVRELEQRVRSAEAGQRLGHALAE